MDKLTVAERSELMSRIRGKNTVPEIALRRLVWAMGYRYRLHRKNLPGKPDLVFRRQRKIVFMHGCFWHYHADCPKFSMPKTRTEFWIPKLEGNRQRDERNQALLREAGWKILVVWECEMKNRQALHDRLAKFLGEQSASSAH